MAEEAIAVLEHLAALERPDQPNHVTERDNVARRTHLVGWSDGGIISLIIAKRRPDLIDRMVLIGANFHFSGVRAMDAGEDGPDPFFEMIQASYAQRSPEGAGHFADIAKKTFTLFATEPTMTVADLGTIAVPTLVLVGDDDLIELAHTCAMYEAIPGARLAVVAGASHALPLEQPEQTARIIDEFLRAPATPATLMPSRRT